jgi:3-deoxy-D-manno-octulosonate 8-phosphate phosphatase (KDO 8-P phosphatase)
LTDGTVWLDGAGNETKRISFADVMGVSLGQRAGLKFALISGEEGAMLDAIAAKFGIEDVFRGCKDKAAALREFAANHRLDLREVCFIGDDVNDVAALEICGLAVVPAGAHASALARAAVVTARSGGMGSLREAIDTILSVESPDAPDGGIEGQSEHRQTV